MVSHKGRAEGAASLLQRLGRAIMHLLDPSSDPNDPVLYLFWIGALASTYFAWFAPLGMDPDLKGMLGAGAIIAWVSALGGSILEALIENPEDESVEQESHVQQ